MAFEPLSFIWPQKRGEETASLVHSSVTFRFSLTLGDPQILHIDKTAAAWSQLLILGGSDTSQSPYQLVHIVFFFLCFPKLLCQSPKNSEGGCVKEMVRTTLRILVHLNVSFAFSFLFVYTQTLRFAALSLERSCLSYLLAHKSPRQVALPQWQQALSNLIFVPCSPNTISKLQT